MKNSFIHSAILIAALATSTASALAKEETRDTQKPVGVEEQLDMTATGSIPGGDCSPTSLNASLVCRVTGGQTDVKFPSTPFMIPSGY